MTYPSAPDRVRDMDLVSEILRPAAILPERAARAAISALGADSVAAGGVWLTTPTTWTRFDRPWTSTDDPGQARVVGRVYISYGSVSQFEIRIDRATITHEGALLRWTIAALCDEVLLTAGLTLSTCPRARINPPPKPFTSAARAASMPTAPPVAPDY